MKKNLLLLTILLLAVGADLLLSRFGLRTSRFELTAAGVEEPIRIVLLSDLHSTEFGADNQRLLRQVAAQDPDLIFLTGDLVSENDPDASVAMSLITALRAVAPVYASLGNHELAFDTARRTSAAALYAQAGAEVLDRAYADVTVKGTALRIGGVYGYCLPPDDPNAKSAESAFLEEFTATDRVKLLLCHIPTGWLARGSLEAWDVDAVFSGHLHGGQFRLPFVGAVYAPLLGWFPGRLDGVYPSADGTRALVLSRGLGGGSVGLRFHNVPEVVSVTLTAR